MALTWRTSISVNRFEVLAIALLLIAINISVGSSSMMGLVVAAAQICFMLALFIISRTVLGHFHETTAKLFFAGLLVFLSVEATLHLLTGLHVNWFVINLILEDFNGRHTGIPFFQLGLLLATLLAIALILRARLQYSISLPSPMALLASCIAAFTIAQISYAILYFNGAADAMLLRRGLPFFWAPHPYQSQKLLGYVMGPRQDNPFAMSKIERQSSALSNQGKRQRNYGPLDLKASPPNVLFLIADSIRAVDLEKPASDLMPNLNAAAAQGMLNLSHNSVSNCTHFSLFSMFTGQLSTEFGDTRRRQKPVGLLPELVNMGYTVTTAETESLDWYDLSEILIPIEAQRWISPSEDALLGDTAVSQKTIEQLSTWANDPSPNAHFAFYQGSHFPYGKSLNGSFNTLFEQYQATIRLFDQEIGTVLRAVNALGLSDNTVVIVTSDHGEEFLSDGRLGHATRLSQKQTIVPLLVLGGDETTHSIRSHLDITPFIHSQITKTAPALVQQNTGYMANCDYDYPNGFIVQQDDQSFEFSYDDGYLISMDGQRENKDLHDEAALLLLRTITNQGVPTQATD